MRRPPGRWQPTGPVTSRPALISGAGRLFDAVLCEGGGVDNAPENIVVVGGAGTGIGRATAQRLVTAGFGVAASGAAVSRWTS